MTSEEVVLTLAQGIFEQGRYLETRELIKEKHEMLQTDATKLKLLRLWEESLYQEFALAKQTGSDPGLKADISGLSSSMRYKLRKKHPCPIELEQELRVKNARLPKVVHDGLNSWLKIHKDNPYPNKKEKENLSDKLGITPQQVNRWFIQRRKMIRLRGVDYVGRFDSPLDDDYPDDDMMDDDGSNDSYDGEMTYIMAKPGPTSPLANESSANSSSSSLLKNILTLKHGGASGHHPLQLALSSGGSIQVIDNIKQNISRLLISEDDILTPPPSVSGDSTARATPSDFPEGITLEQREALDLSLEPKSSQASSHHDLHSSAESSRRSSACSSPTKDQMSYGCAMDLAMEEQIAVNALLTLSHGGL